MADESVCELLEVGLGMLARARLSEGLRGTAQSCVQIIVRAVFGRLKGLTQEDVDKLLESAKEKEKEAEVQEDGKDEEDLTPPPFTPYGLPTILELLRVLIALLDPADQAHTDSMRLAALSVLNTALEVGGSSLGEWSELREGVRDEGCRYLFQLTRSDASILLGQSLRSTSTLFSTMLPHLKLQLELFLSYLIDRLTPQTPPPQINYGNSSRPSTPSLATFDHTDTAPSTPRPISLLPPVPNETRELMLETLTQIALRPSFMADCWVNYDCSADSEDIFERLIGFLTRGVYPSGPPKQDGTTNLFDGLDAAQLLSLEILLGFVSSMSERMDDGGESWPSVSLRCL
jgi:brefeldin A-resistance guanine nucleotide exchange factor 1